MPNHLDKANKILGTYTDPIPEQLLQAFSSGKVIAFVGAGLSIRCLSKNRKPLPDWHNFLRSLIDWSDSEVLLAQNTAKELHSLLDRNEFLLVAQELRECLGDKVFGRFVSEVFEPDGITPTRLHELLMIAPFAGYITTNYDNLLERAYSQVFHRQIRSVNLADFPLSEDKKFLLKLHGDIDDPSSIVLAHRDYLKMIWDSKRARIIRKLLTEYTFLFIGYSLSDLDILLPLDELSYKGKKCLHFMLSEKGIRNTVERKRLLHDRQVQLIEYKDYFDFHNHIDTFIEGLVWATNNQDSIYRVKRKLFRRIQVHYTPDCQDDGEFVWNYIFREGAITFAPPTQEKQWEVLKEHTIKQFPTTDYLIFVTSAASLENQETLDTITLALDSATKAGVHVIFLIAGSIERSSFLKKQGAVLPTFLLRQGFSEVDLEPVRKYLEENIKTKWC